MSGKGGRPDYSGYNYGAISSLVLTTDRSALPRRDKKPDDAPNSLAGQIDPKEMGSKVHRQVPKDLDKKKKAFVKADPSEKAALKRKADFSGFGYADIIEATREVYELTLSAVHTALGDQAQDIVRSAVDLVLEILKNEQMKDFDKKKEIEEILGPITSERFAQLVNLSKKITDYDPNDETEADPDDERKEAEIDEEGGVAIVIDEEEQEEDEEDYEIRDESGGEDEKDDKA